MIGTKECRIDIYWQTDWWRNLLYIYFNEQGFRLGGRGVQPLGMPLLRQFLNRRTDWDGSIDRSIDRWTLSGEIFIGKFEFTWWWKVVKNFRNFFERRDCEKTFKTAPLGLSYAHVQLHLGHTIVFSDTQTVWPDGLLIWHIFNNEKLPNSINHFAR